MYDPYSEPNYNPGGGAMPQEPKGFSMPQFNAPSFDTSGLQGPSIDFKKFIPIIAVLIIVAIIGFGVLFWLGMQQNVTFNITDTDGNPVEGKLTLKDAGGKTLVITTLKGTSSTFSATLMNGNYTVTAKADGYADTVLPIIVSSEEKKFSIAIPKNLNATLSITFDSTQIYDGQVIKGTLSVQNNSDSPFKVTDIISNSSTNIDAKITSTNIDTLLPGPTFLDFNVKVKSASPLVAQADGYVQFKIKGTSILSEKKTLIELPVIAQASVDIIPAGKISLASLSAGNRTPLVITIKNKNTKFPLSNVLLTIDTDKSEYKNNLDWLEFTQAVTGQPNSILIENIDPNGSQSVTLNVTPSVNAIVGDSFLGYLSVKSYSIKDQEKRADVDFKVSTAKKSQVDIVGLSTPFSIVCNKTTLSCKPNYLSNGEVKVKNSGNTIISDVRLSIDLNSTVTTTNCQQYITKFTSATSSDTFKATIAQLTPGQEMQVIVDMTPTYEDPSIHAVCGVKLTYIDELDPTQVVQKTTQIEMNKTGLN